MHRTPAPLDLARLRRRLNRVAAGYAKAAQVEQEIGRRLLEHLDPIRLEPHTILDAGCGEGFTTLALAARYPRAQILALDHAEAMLAELRLRLQPLGADVWQRLRGFFKTPPRRELASIHPLLADLHAPPVAAGQIDLLWCHAAMHWSNDLPRLIATWASLLRTEGLLIFALPGPDTGRELRQALSKAGLAPRVHDFTDLHDIGDMLLAAGLADPVMEMESLTLEYPDPASLWRELRTLGLVSARGDRPRGLMTPRQLARLESELMRNSLVGTPLRMTLEVIYGHAWKPAPRASAKAPAIVRLDAIGGRGRASPRSA